MEIKVITIDYWGTLFKSNPDYAPIRDKVVYEYLSKESRYSGTIEHLVATYNTVKDLIIRLEFKTGDSLTIMQRHVLFFNKLEVGLQHLTEEYFNIIKTTFRLHPPVPVYHNVLDIVEKLSVNYDVHILSNTGMAPTSLIREQFSNLDVELYLSDEVRYCKPNTKFYGDWFGECCQTEIYSKWLHIGDDIVNDIEPVTKLGGRTFLISNFSDWDNIKRLFVC